MNLRFYQRLRYHPVRCLLMLASAALPVVATAGDFDCGSDIVPAGRAHTPCEFELAGTEELCGWVTEDTRATPVPAKQAARSPSDSSIEASLTAIATAACTSAGVSVEQFVEPLAMVGVYLDESLEKMVAFHRWWEAAIRDAAQRPASIPVVTIVIEDEVKAIAAEEPMDVEGLGPSVLSSAEQYRALSGAEQNRALSSQEQEAEQPQPGIRVTAIDRLVGSSPIIVTIEDSYHSYDLSTRDMKLWSVFPTSTHPFCIRCPLEDSESSPMWQEFEAAVRSQSDVVVSDEAFACRGSAECLLDELIGRVEYWTASGSLMWVALEPRSIGQRLGSLVSRGNRIAVQAARLLGSNWPEVIKDNQPSPAGQALLARAGASEGFETVASAEAQIAQTPSAAVIR